MTMMMFSNRFIVALLLACATGCASNKSKDASRAPAPGRAALSVTVRAEPKRGWRDPRRESATYDMSTVGTGRAYETIDYGALDDIVVWVDASDDATSTNTLTIDVAQPSTPIKVCGPRDTWTIENSGAEPLAIYARQESGDVTDLGSVAPRATVAHQPQATGFIEILSDARPYPMARVYVAPSSRACVLKGGRPVTFEDLPPGPALVTAWHPRLPGATARVELTPGATRKATLVIGVNQLPKVP